METSSFFNSVNGDRIYSAIHWADYFSSFVENGIFLTRDGQLGINPSVSNEMNVFLQPGKAFINGYFYKNDELMRIDLQPSDSLKNRIDSIVIQWNLSERSIKAKVRSSELAENPVSVTPTRTEEIYELVLFEIFIPKGSKTTSFANIKDKRFDENLCGFITSVGQRIDTSDFNKILNDFYDRLETLGGMRNVTEPFPAFGKIIPENGISYYIGEATTNLYVAKPIMWDGYPITANIAFKKGAAERITFDKTNMGESEGFRVKNTTFDLSGFEADDTVIINITNDTVTVSKGI